MAIELKTDGWRRYMMYRSDEHYMTFEAEARRREAAEAGQKFAAMAYADVWAKDAELVKRVRAFLGKNFHWHDRLVKSGADLDVVQALKEMVRGGSVVVIPEDAMQGGSVGTALLPPTMRAYSVMDPETAAEMRAIARRILYPPGEVVLSGPYRPDRQASGQLAAARAAMAKAAGGSTPLGDAQPFQYSEGGPSGDTFDIAKTPNVGDPGTWYTNPGSGQMRFYGGDGGPLVDFDFDHDHGQGLPHAHNWAIDPLSGKRGRGAGLPMSILP